MSIIVTICVRINPIHEDEYRNIQGFSSPKLEEIATSTIRDGKVISMGIKKEEE